MKINEIIFLFLIIFGPLCWSYSPKEGNISAHVGLLSVKTNFKEAKAPVSNPDLPGAGIVVTGDVSDSSALEVALFYFNKRYLRFEDSQALAEETQLIHITMGYRRWISSRFSASLAISTGYPLGDVKTLYSSQSPPRSFITSARDVVEYGADFAVQYELWEGSQFDVVTDLRYGLSLTSRSKEEADHFAAMIGLRYLLQEKTDNK